MTDPYGIYTIDLENKPPRDVDKDTVAHALLVELVRLGVLVGVEVFGADSCCEHGDFADCDAAGFGLCDVFGPHSVGSDCNRAERWLLRPRDGLLSDDLHAEINRQPAPSTGPRFYDGGPRR